MKINFKKNFIKKAGFTFVETLLAVIIVGAVAGVAAKVLISGLDVYALVMNRHDASQTARLGMERMVDELILLEISDISTLADTRFNFYDASGSLTNFKRYTATFRGQSVPCIYRDEDFLAGNVTYLDFDYFNDVGASTIWPWQVRRINIDFTVGALANAGSVHLRTDVFPRNFMYSNFQ